MPRKEIKVAIVDDSPFDRNLLFHYLKNYKNCKVVFEAVNGFDLLHKMNNQSVDIIVMDMYMPKMDGIEALINLQSQDRQTQHEKLTNKSKIIFVSNGYEPNKIPLLKKLGATGYCSKSKKYFDIAFQLILSGETYFENAIHVKNVDEFLHATIQFSGKEIEIIQYLSVGLTYEEISLRIPHLSAKTIELYVQSMVLKYNFKNKIQMITYCYSLGIISIFEGFNFHQTSNIKHQTSNIKHQASTKSPKLSSSIRKFVEAQKLNKLKFHLHFYQ